ncbi:hypothetical protein ACQY0O_004905 [Thecaphora frezii]
MELNIVPAHDNAATCGRSKAFSAVKQPEVHPPPGNGTYEADLALAFSPFGSFKHTVPDAGGGGPIDENDIQWQRKMLWVGQAFATMAMPALVCFVGLRRSGRQTYWHSLTDHQKTFLERQLSHRIPSSYFRCLWFIVYLETLPHTGIDGIAYVSFWTLTVNGMALVSHWILEEKVRSRALLFEVKDDEAGNAVFRYAANNFSAAFGKNAETKIVEVEHIVPIGSLDPNEILLPSIYVDRIVKATSEKEIELRTVSDAPKKSSRSSGETNAAKEEARAFASSSARPRSSRSDSAGAAGGRDGGRGAAKDGRRL